MPSYKVQTSASDKQEMTPLFTRAANPLNCFLLPVSSHLVRYRVPLLRLNLA